jgi:hypothetical protein
MQGPFQFGQESCEAIPALYEPDPLAHLSLASVDQPAGGRVSPSMQSDTGLVAPEQVIGLAWASVRECPLRLIPPRHCGAEQVGC